MSRDDNSKQTIEQLETIINHVHDAIFTTKNDQSYTIESWNAGAQRIYGWEKDEIVGKSAYIFQNEYPNKDNQKVLEEILRSGIYEGEVIQSRKDGTRVNIDAKVVGVKDAAGKIVQWVCVNREISDRKIIEKEMSKSEEQLHEILDSMPFGVAIIDMNKKVNYINRAALEMMDREDPQEVIGKICHSVFCPANKNNCPILDLQQKLDRSERILLTKNHENKEILKSVVPIVIKGEELLLESFIDISDRKKAQREKEEMQQGLFQTSKMAMIGELAAGVGHEINNPLAIINGYIAVIKKFFDKNCQGNDLIKNAFRAQKDSVNRIKDVVEGLRTFSMNVADGEIEIFDLNKINQSVLNFLRGMYQKDDIYIETSFSAEPLYIKGDKEKYRQIITNLLNNAKDALSGKKNKKIEIHSFTTRENNTIKIMDNGKGLEDNAISKIFNAFYTTKEVGKGTGLGLTVVKNLMEGMGGKVTVESEKDKGTTFILKFPPVTNTQESSKEIFEQLTGKVLLVEDEDYLRKIISQSLNEFGLEVDTAANGEDGIQKFANNQYDYILTDIKMPLMDGEEMIQKIRQSEKFEGKIFVITGVVDRDVSLLPIDGYLRKPFDEDDLYDFLRKNK